MPYLENINTFLIALILYSWLVEFPFFKIEFILCAWFWRLFLIMNSFYCFSRRLEFFYLQKFLSNTSSLQKEQIFSWVVLWRSAATQQSLCQGSTLVVLTSWLFSITMAPQMWGLNVIVTQIELQIKGWSWWHWAW